MTTIQLLGGLGNQMFQYAFGRWLEIDRGARVFFDSRAFEGYPLRRPELDAYRVVYREAPALADGIRRLRMKLASKFDGLNRRVGFGVGVASALRPEVIREANPFLFQDFSRPISGYFEGFWQSYRYLDPIRARLIEEFSLREELHPSLATSRMFAESESSVALHVRRGDYVSNPEAARFHGILPLDYYRNALAELKKAVKRPRVVVFSDDIKWAEENLNFSFEMAFVPSDPHRRPAHDIALFSKCRHQVIANSSFSYWGAYLNPNPHKRVFVPANWTTSLRTTDAEIVPLSWTVIDYP